MHTCIHTYIHTHIIHKYILMILMIMIMNMMLIIINIIVVILIIVAIMIRQPGGRFAKKSQSSKRGSRGLLRSVIFGPMVAFNKFEVPIPFIHVYVCVYIYTHIHTSLALSLSLYIYIYISGWRSQTTGRMQPTQGRQCNHRSRYERHYNFTTYMNLLTAQWVISASYQRK